MPTADGQATEREFLEGLRPEDRDCPGTCCAAFELAYSPLELALAARGVEDGILIAAMVIPLTPEEAGERNLAAGGDGDINPDRHHYTCRYWDERTRLCRNYEGRPAMCRDYPYGEPCHHGCGYCGGTPRAKRGGDDG